MSSHYPHLKPILLVIIFSYLYYIEMLKYVMEFITFSFSSNLTNINKVQLNLKVLQDLIYEHYINLVCFLKYYLLNPQILIIY